MKIFCLNTNTAIPVRGGETLLDIYRRMPQDSLGFTPICALVNNKSESLKFAVFSPKQVEFVPLGTPLGHRVYLRSLCMMLYKAVHDLMPDAVLTMEGSRAAGLYCRILEKEDRSTRPLDENAVESLKSRMREIVDADIPFVRHERRTPDVIDLFRSQGLDDKVKLLETVHELYTVYYMLDDIADSYYGPLVPSTGMLGTFNLVPYSDGFLLAGPDPGNKDIPQQPETQSKIYRTIAEYRAFNRAIRVSCVGELNNVVKERRTAELINVAEAMHDKYLGAISSEICDRYRRGGARIILIAGPSSSGKTTSAKRLAVQLMTNLMVPKLISLDDYFVDREHTPLDIDGGYDYESLYALDLERLNSDLRRLLDGEQINLPTYSFEFGRRVDKQRPLRLDHNDVLLIEGIHGLNPELITSIHTDDVFKIYVSALTTLKIDDHNWIPTSDNRLLRRIVRDAKYRNTTALETIRRWASVRRGEEKWIFPFQENADAMFNSSLIFELGAMKSFAEPVLHMVPHDVPEYAEAYRLLKFLSYFESIPAEQIPHTSLLREFLGGSSFKY